MPLVSVVVPAYNAAAFIGQAIDSVRAQSVRDVEVVVVNDGSPDTAALEHAIAGLSSTAGLVYVQQPNGGPSSARNTGLRAASGEIVALLDADDWWEPGYLEAQLEELRRSDLDLVYCDTRLVGESPLAGRTYMGVTPSNGPVTLESLLAFTANIPTTCVVARRAAMLAVGGFDESLRRCEDYDLWLRMAAAGSRMGYHRAVLASRRIHGAGAAADRAAMMESQVRVFRKLATQLGPAHPATASALRQARRAEADRALELSKRQLRAGAYREARALLAEARRFYRSRKLALAALGLRAAPGLVRRFYRASA